MTPGVNISYKILKLFWIIEYTIHLDYVCWFTISKFLSKMGNAFSDNDELMEEESTTTAVPSYLKVALQKVVKFSGKFAVCVINTICNQMSFNLWEEESEDSLITSKEKRICDSFSFLECLDPIWRGNIFPVSYVLQEWSMSIQPGQLWLCPHGEQPWKRGRICISRFLKTPEQRSRAPVSIWAGLFIY